MSALAVRLVIGMAVTTEGVPVRCWTFPVNTSDQVIIRTIKDDLAGWMLNRVVWVADRGFNSVANRAYLQSGGGPGSRATPGAPDGSSLTLRSGAGPAVDLAGGRWSTITPPRRGAVRNWHPFGGDRHADH